LTTTKRATAQTNNKKPNFIFLLPTFITQLIPYHQQTYYIKKIVFFQYKSISNNKVFRLPKVNVIAIITDSLT